MKNNLPEEQYSKQAVRQCNTGIVTGLAITMAGLFLPFYISTLLPDHAWWSTPVNILLIMTGFLAFVSGVALFIVAYNTKLELS